ncbi:MAG: insulinase family protein [Victivallaceae bacterium]
MMFVRGVWGLSTWLLPFAAAAATLVFSPKPDDPLPARSYLLDNGATVLVLPNYSREKISYSIVFDVGFIDDPPELEGAAHFVEHLMAKGTTRLGTTDYAAEKPVLDKIDALYVEYDDKPERERLEVDCEIDRLSVEASHFMIPNEFFNTIVAMGGTGFNAMTTQNCTFFYATVPVESFARAMTLETERFSAPVFRGFRTEQNVIRAEAQRFQDGTLGQFQEKAMCKMYGPQSPLSKSGIGDAETIDRMSPAKLLDFFHKHYLPGNMTVIVTGPIESPDVIRVLERTIGTLPAGKSAPRCLEPMPPFAEPVTATINVPRGDIVSATLGWRLPGLSDKESMMADAVAGMLAAPSGRARRLVSSGRLADLQAVFIPDLKCGNNCLMFTAYSNLPGDDPRRLAALLEVELAALRDGDFDEKTIKVGAEQDMFLFCQLAETGNVFISNLTIAIGFTGIDWQMLVDYWRRELNLTKPEIVDFCQRRLTENHLTLLQRDAPDDSPPPRVPTKTISALECPRNVSSSFARSIAAMPDFKPQLRLEQPERKVFRSTMKLHDNGRTLPAVSVVNTGNDFFRLQLVFDAGYFSDPALPLAVKLFEAAKPIFCEYAATAKGECTAFRTTITLDGLHRNQAASIGELVQLLNDPSAADETLISRATSLLREDRRLQSLSTELQYEGFVQYLSWGDNSPLRQTTTMAELKTLHPSQVAGILKKLAGNSCRVYYYGPESGAETLTGQLVLPPEAPPTVAPGLDELERPAPRLYLYSHNSLNQNYVGMVRLSGKTDSGTEALRRWLNEYYNALLFREVREKRGLCYFITCQMDLPEGPNNRRVFTVKMSMDPKKTVDAVRTVRDAGFPEDCGLAEKTRLSLIRNWRRGTGGTRLLEEAEEIDFYGFSPDSASRWADQLESASFGELSDFYSSQIAGYDAIMVIGRLSRPAKAILGSATSINNEDLFSE